MFHVVDDEGVMCSLIATIIDCAGYDSICFYSAEAYLKYMQTRSYQAPVALLTDAIMPQMNGRELAGEVYKKMPHQRVVLISGSVGDNIEQGWDCFYTCLSKPVDHQVLVKLLHDLLIESLLYPRMRYHSMATT